MHGKGNLLQALRLYVQNPQIVVAALNTAQEVDGLLRIIDRKVRIDDTVFQELQSLKKQVREQGSEIFSQEAVCIAINLASQEFDRVRSRAFDGGLVNLMLRWADQNFEAARRLFTAILECPNKAQAIESDLITDATLALLLSVHGKGLKTQPIRRSILSLYRASQSELAAKVILVRMVNFLARQRCQLIAEGGSLFAPEDVLSPVFWDCPEADLPTVRAFEQSIAKDIYIREAGALAPRRKVDWQILPSGSRDPVEQVMRLVLNSGKKGEKSKRADESRRPYIVALEKMKPLRRWEGIVLTESGGVYVAYEFPRYGPFGKVAAEAISKGDNALYVVDMKQGDCELGDEYRPGATNVPSWHHILGQRKEIAQQRGAERYYHTKTGQEWDEKLTLILSDRYR